MPVIPARWEDEAESGKFQSSLTKSAVYRNEKGPELQLGGKALARFNP